MRLIEQIANAVISKKLECPFTTADMKRWEETNRATVKTSKKKNYKKSTLDSILSDSLIELEHKHLSGSYKNKNKNKKYLKSELNKDKEYQYWFVRNPFNGEAL